MSNNTVTIATLPRLEAPDLSRIILSTASSNLDAPQTAPEGLAIIDVRDDGEFYPPSAQSLPS
jgi:hypothetical protein